MLTFSCICASSVGFTFTYSNGVLGWGGGLNGFQMFWLEMLKNQQFYRAVAPSTRLNQNISEDQR